MENNSQPPLEVVKPRPPTKAYKDMNGREKAIFIFKLAVCILTFGMVFPNAGD